MEAKYLRNVSAVAFIQKILKWMLIVLQLSLLLSSVSEGQASPLMLGNLYDFLTY